MTPTDDVPLEVVLRPVVPDDLPILFEQQRDPESTRMAAFPGRDLESFTAHWAKIMADPTTALRAIVVGGRTVGHIVAWDADEGRTVGYWVGREHWGRGIATRALATFVEGVATERPLHARVAEHNAASLRVLQKCGFVVVGRDRWVLDDGADNGEELVLTLPA